MSKSSATPHGTEGLAAERPLFFLPALQAGGSERVVTAIANEWAKRGRRPIIVTYDKERTPPYYPLDERVRLIQLDLPPDNRSLFRALARTRRRTTSLRSVIRDEAPDVVISFLTKTNVVAVLAAMGSDCPVIVSERNNPAIQRPNALWRAARRFSYPRAFAFVTMTQGAADTLPAVMKPRARVIPNPAVLPGEINRVDGGKRLVAAGRLVEQKGFDMLLDAFADAAKDCEGWTLTVYGEGNGRAAFEAQRKALGLEDRVSFPGVSRGPAAWTAEADLFVFSSRYEGWGVVIIEAMAAGLPVVSFDCDFGPGEIIDHGENGVLVPPGDVKALAGALKELMLDPERRNRLGARAREDVRRNYAVETIAEQWGELADEAARRNG
ncbi:MAG: glycosyltransferase family 4 protein [Parvularculaceae bacterium]